jgi:hypothetical protein
MTSDLNDLRLAAIEYLLCQLWVNSMKFAGVTEQEFAWRTDAMLANLQKQTLPGFEHLAANQLKEAVGHLIHIQREMLGFQKNANGVMPQILDFNQTIRRLATITHRSKRRRVLPRRQALAGRSRVQQPPQLSAARRLRPQSAICWIAVSRSFTSTLRHEPKRAKRLSITCRLPALTTSY